MLGLLKANLVTDNQFNHNQVTQITSPASSSSSSVTIAPASSSLNHINLLAPLQIFLAGGWNEEDHSHDALFDTLPYGNVDLIVAKRHHQLQAEPGTTPSIFKSIAEQVRWLDNSKHWMPDLAEVSTMLSHRRKRKYSAGGAFKKVTYFVHKLRLYLGNVSCSVS